MLRTFLSIAGALIFLFLFVRYIEIRSLYVPFRQVYGTPKTLGLAYDDLFLVTPDRVTVNAWFIPRTGAKFTLFYLHGNGGNLSHRLPQISLFHELGVNIFIVDYRGYGLSTGRPSEKGIYTDAQTSYDYLKATLKIPANRIILFGESLGTAVAVHLAEKNQVRAIILAGGFTSAAQLSRRVYPFLPTFFLTSRFDSLSVIDKIQVPKLFIHSVNDEIVPFDMGLKLFQAAAAPKEFFEIHGGHNDAFVTDRENLKKRMHAFFESLVQL